jgi:glycosyltransferase involved in cell wall biosynthesis
MIVIDIGGVKSKRGIASYINSIISGLADKKDSVNCHEKIILLAPRNIRCSLSKDVNFENIEIIYRPYINQIVWEIFLVPIYAKFLKATLIHYTGNTGGVLFPKLFKIPIVVTIHDVSFLKRSNIVPQPRLIRQKLGHLYRSYNTPRVARNAKKIITVSEFSKQDILLEIGCNRDKVVVIYNSLRNEFLVKGSQMERQKIILLVTGDGGQKNLGPTLKCLLENQKELFDWLIMVVGIDSRESTDFVKYIGRVEPVELVQYYDMASIFLMPSLYESFSIPIIEALSRRASVVASNRGAVKEILKGYGYTYNPTSCLDLMEIIKKIKCNMGNDVYSKNCSEEYAKSFLPTKLARQTVAVYQEALLQND